MQSKASTETKFVIDHGWKPGVIGTLIELQAKYYATHHGFGHHFEAVLCTGLGDFLSSYDPSRDRLLHAWADGACIGGLAVDGGTAPSQGADAKLRWFIVAPSIQQRGVGHTLMHESLLFCSEAGHRTVLLETFRGLEAARVLYERHGFVLQSEAETRRWGPPVMEQVFIRETALA
jgi:GNAT superfamily N-acetyltransferase